MSHHREPDRQERGAGAVLVLGLGCAGLVLAGCLAGLGAAVLARHRAESLADLAALAAAGSAGPPDCARAVRMVSAGGAGLARCQVLSDDSVVVTVIVGSWAARAGGGGGAMATARAGRRGVVRSVERTVGGRRVGPDRVRPGSWRGSWGD